MPGLTLHCSAAMLALLAAALVLSATPAASQPPAGSGAADFKGLDANGDGRLQRDETIRYRALHQSFDASDTDGDGNLSAEEFSAFEADPAAVTLPGRKPKESWFTAPQHQPD